jgi:DNA-binding NarL/FixJ family response regulator
LEITLATKTEYPTIDTKQVRLVIADDHPVFRDGLRRFLEAKTDHKVIGEASDGAEAVKVVRQLKPDILLLDPRMPRYDGMYALRELSSPANPTPVRVILLTAAIEKGQIVEALQFGARGVVLKDSATQVLLNAIETVIAGEYWVHREPVSNLVQSLRTLMQSTHDEQRQQKYGLTPRELEIVSAVVAGYSNKEIAEYFKISEDTVNHHLSKIFDKLGVAASLVSGLFSQTVHSLRQRIPQADPEKYRHIMDGSDWRNPMLVVRPEGIEIVGITPAGQVVTADSVPEKLEHLPDSAWPYGLIVMVSDASIVSSPKVYPRIQTNRSKLLKVLKTHGIAVHLWSSA